MLASVFMPLASNICGQPHQVAAEMRAIEHASTRARQTLRIRRVIISRMTQGCVMSLCHAVTEDDPALQRDLQRASDAIAALEVSVGLDPGAETNPIEADLPDSDGSSDSEG